MTDKTQALSNMTTRQKATAGVVAVVVLIILWQLYSMLGGGKSVPKPAATPAAMTKPAGPGAMPSAGGEMQPPQMITPKPAELTPAPAMSESEAQILKMQQETQAKYIEAMNELQMLKVARDIAQTNKDIAAANLAKVTSDKKIVDLLAPPAPPPTPATYAKNIANPPASAESTITQEVKYTVISVSQLQYRWTAVIGWQGNLYNVHVGDVLPPDGSSIVSIAKDGVVLMKDGVKKKISLVPII